MTELGHELRFHDTSHPWAGWDSDGRRPYFVICKPYDGKAHHPGNGQMVAFLAPSHEVVRSVHATALANGGTCEGPPGPRPRYHEHYYGAYVRDLDSNKFRLACHVQNSGEPSAA